MKEARLAAEKATVYVLFFTSGQTDAKSEEVRTPINVVYPPPSPPTQPEKVYSGDQAKEQWKRFPSDSLEAAFMKYFPSDFIRRERAKLEDAVASIVVATHVEIRAAEVFGERYERAMEILRG